MKKTLLITGGSSGIGYEVSRYFAKDNYRLLWVSKPEEELHQAKAKIEEEIPNVEIHTLPKDLSLPHSPKEVYDWVKENDWTIDVLINNAGFGTYGFIQETSLDKEVAMINLNVLCVYKLTRLFLDDMITKNQGTIINISSNSSFQPVPKMNTYASTKAFVTHFSRALTEELKMQKSKVKLMTVCPSAVKNTAFRKGEGLNKIKTFEGMAYTTVEEVAKDIWKGFQKGKPFVVTGRKMRFLYAFSHLIPYRIQQMLVKRETGVMK